MSVDNQEPKIGKKELDRQELKQRVDHLLELAQAFKVNSHPDTDTAKDSYMTLIERNVKEIQEMLESSE